MAAQKNGWFKEEIVPVTIETKGKERRSGACPGETTSGDREEPSPMDIRISDLWVKVAGAPYFVKFCYEL